MRFLQFDPHGKFTLTRGFTTPPAPYAILSHTWGADDDEVTFYDLQKDRGKGKGGEGGYKKLLFRAEQAKKERLEYVWVDTCWMYCR